MNGLALCSGIAGLDLGLARVVPGYRTVCHVERDAYAAAVLVARMEDKALDPAPVWDDLTTFPGREWRGLVDIVTAGFPCQPWSVAGKRQGTDDERWIWPAIAALLGDVRPEWVFLENVPGLVRGGLGPVLGDLAALGFDAEWDLFSAGDVGAPHRRERWFCLGHAQLARRAASWERCDQHAGAEPQAGSGAVAHADQPGPQGRGRDGGRAKQWPVGPSGSPMEWPPGPDDLDAWSRVPEEAWPAVRGVASRLPARVDRLRCLGNAVVPAQAALAFSVLLERSGWV